jgi:hypothetical protein
MEAVMAGRYDIPIPKSAIPLSQGLRIEFGSCSRMHNIYQQPILINHYCILFAEQTILQIAEF